MKPQTKPALVQSTYQYLVDIAEQVPIIAVMGCGGKTKTAVLSALGFERHNINVQLCNLDQSATVPLSLVNTDQPDLIVVNCPKYSTDEKSPSIYDCAKVARLANINLLAIGNEAHHLPHTFNLLMGMIDSCNVTTLFHYIYVNTGNNNGVVNATNVRSELNVLCDLQPKGKVKFESLGEIAIAPAINEFVNSGFAQTLSNSASKTYQQTVQALIKLIQQT